MIRIERIELLGWDMQPDQYVLLRPGVNLLTGENGSGKTSILDALKVVLGARRLGGDRSPDDYLRVRDPAVAMIRAVVDNRPAPNGRRPFDVLGGGYDAGQVSLAIVFSATDDGYDRAYYIVDGDVSPLADGVEARPFRAGDYRSRLDRLGLGESFRRLLATPQGEVAALCRQSAGELFDLLYDFIGGKEVFDRWQQLRHEYETWERQRKDRTQAFNRIDSERAALAERVERHEDYCAERDTLRRRGLALPLARQRHLETERQARLDEAQAAGARVAEAEREAAELRAARADRESQHAATTRQREELDDRLSEERRARTAVEGELVDARVRWGRLEEVRLKAVRLPARDAQALTATLAETRREVAAHEHEIERLDARRAALTEELDAIERGVLDPPAAVRILRNALRREGVPHEVLFDLLEPVEPDGVDRTALESYLGDLRFAVAVPDVDAFTRAVAVAREQAFPYYVLAPDVRSPRPEGGVYPLLDAVHVKEPRYQGLITRLLRRVGWLEGAIDDTYRGRGALVDARGYVLDRIGGVHRGTDRFYLGRDALARRRAALLDERESLAGQRRAQRELRDAATARVDVTQRMLDEERERQAWLTVEAEHVAARSEVSRLEARQAHHREAEEGTERELRGLQERREELAAAIGTYAAHIKQREADGESATRAASRARREAEEADRALTELEQAAADASAALDAASAADKAAVERILDESGPSVLDHLVREGEKRIARYPEADRDPQLPHNLRTLERQLTATRGELDRITASVEEARRAVDSAYDQYVRVTKRQFRAYFARLAEEARLMDFTVQGTLRERDDQRFEVALDVAVGEKAPVPYSSRTLSGGQKAALSILMAMSTLGVSEDDGPGFFLVDEPFSASDTHKIQELGEFLGRTGAQYLVSMPTSLDIGRCGAWLSSVLTCTRSAGGHDGEGRLRLAPPVKFSVAAPR